MGVFDGLMGDPIPGEVTAAAERVLPPHLRLGLDGFRDTDGTIYLPTTINPTWWDQDDVTDAQRIEMVTGPSPQLPIRVTPDGVATIVDRVDTSAMEWIGRRPGGMMPLPPFLRERLPEWARRLDEDD